MVLRHLLISVSGVVVEDSFLRYFHLDKQTSNDSSLQLVGIHSSLICKKLEGVLCNSIENYYFCSAFCAK